MAGNTLGSEYDVVIVGARVAGAIVAALLGEAGCSVLLVDRAAFPSLRSPRISSEAGDWALC